MGQIYKKGNAYFKNSVATTEQKERLNANDLNQKQAVLQVLETADESMNDREITEEIRKRKLLNPPILQGSIQRARCNLKKAGKVEVSGKKHPGGYGVDTNCWRIKKQPAEQSDMFGKPEVKHQGAYSGAGQ